MSRRQTAESDEDIQKEDMGVEHAEVSTHKLQPSAKPKADLRLVVLGGDAADNSYACSTILRYRHLEETINPLKGDTIERTVGGRQVSVFRTPSYWMEHLATHWFFSNGVESIRHEVQNCTSILFPGPHAFLLVMRADHASGKEHYLLRALTSVFGAEALEYTMVIFVHAHERAHPRDSKDCCVQMCGERVHFLENSDENVEELLTEIETRTNKKKSRFFIQRSYENVMKTCFESWERSRLHAQQRRERKLIEETKAEQQQKETEFQKKLETLELHANDLRKELETYRLSESALRKDLEGSRLSESALRKDLEGSRLSESALRKDLEASRLSKSSLRKDLEASRLSESGLRKDLEGSRFSESGLRKDLEGSRLSESSLRKDLEGSRLSESSLRKDLEESRLSGKFLSEELNKSNDRAYQFQREVVESKLRESELQQKLKDLQAQVEQLKLKKEKRQTARERDLESEVREWSHDTAVARSEEETAESVEAGDVKPARRNSKELVPPYM